MYLKLFTYTMVRLVMFFGGSPAQYVKEMGAFQSKSARVKPGYW